MSNPLPPLPDPSGDPAGWARLMSQLQQVFAATGPTASAPVNWDLAQRVAHSQLTNPPSGTPDVDAATEALRLADMWLDPVTEFPSGMTNATTWQRAEWIDVTLPTWQRLCDPVAVKVVQAMSTLLPNELHDADGGNIPREVLEQVASPLGGLTAAFTRIGGALFGAQVGQGLGTLSQEVLSATDIGIPLGPAGTAALIPTNVTEFAAGLEQPLAEVQLYVALREAAHHRLYQHVPWLRGQVLAAVETYARGIQVDREAFEEAFERMHASLDPNDPSSLQLMVTDQMFTPPATPEQETALARLETLLALIEGWVVHVVDEVAKERLSSGVALSEAFRRRRAAGGPAEQTFATLVGLQLRPRRLRDAANLWGAVRAKRGSVGRDAVWGHPDLIPTAEDLDDPLGFAERDDSVEIEGIDDL